jgi:hypothetical protein
MKKQLTVALGLAVLATPAFASKARLQALGDDVNGSFYINDNRNVFLNAANINNHKDLVTFEWGDTTQGVDANGTPRAEGGLFKTSGNLVYGAYLGSESNSVNAIRQFGANLNGASSQEENNIDVFVGGDAGMKWGANLTYSKSEKNEADGDSEQNALRTRLGVIAGDIEGFANISISNKAEDNAGNEFKGKLGGQIGAIYNLNDYRVFATMTKADGEADGATDEDIKYTKFEVGAGRASKLNDKATLFTKASFVNVKAENDNNAGAGFGATCSNALAFGCEEYKSTHLPVVIGLEYDAASWLVLRSSVAQTIWGKEEDADNKRGFQDTTVVNAGATLKFGELSMDGSIGNGGTTTAGNFNTDGLMSRVSMTYRF